MKRLFVILLILCISLVTFANADFDETCNFQFENAKAYEGEILYLIPITRSRYDGNRISNELYHWFKDYSFNDNETSEYNSYYNYKADPTDYRDSKLLGTHKRHIEAHRFYVMKVMPYHPKSYKYTWVFHLVDLNTGDKLKFISLEVYSNGIIFLIAKFVLICLWIFRLLLRNILNIVCLLEVLN